MEQRKRRAQKGFSLIELMIVMVIIGLLASLVGPTLYNKLSGAKQKTAKVQIANLESALELYRMDVGLFPTTAQGLEALREKPEGADGWDGPYLKKPVPEDPWGHEYVYKSPGDHGEFDLSSHGLDGQSGGEGENKDVNSWEN